MPIFLLNGTKIPQFEQFHAPLSKNNRVLLLNGSIHPLIVIMQIPLAKLFVGDTSTMSPFCLSPISSDSHHKCQDHLSNLNSLYMHPAEIVPQACQMEGQRM